MAGVIFLYVYFLSFFPADILLRAKTVFSDVQEDFSDVKKILSRFVDWRGAYSDSYHNAYINLCLPKLLSPLIRHQMLAWDPLKVHRNGTLTLTHTHTHTLTHSHTLSTHTMQQLFALYIIVCVCVCVCVRACCICFRMFVQTSKPSHGTERWKRSATARATKS